MCKITTAINLFYIKELRVCSTRSLPAFLSEPTRYGILTRLNVDTNLASSTKLNSISIRLQHSSMSSQSSLPPKSHYLLSYPLTPRQDVCILIHESSVPTQTSIYPHKSRCGQSVLDHLVHWLVHQFICCFIFFVCWFTFWFLWFSSRFSCFSY